MTIEIPAPAREIIEVLERNGFEAFVVGGCVRDSLLGLEPHDWDITTNALPAQTISCFKGYKIIETGLKHGTVTIMSGNEPFEVTTYRVDGQYSDNRHPDSVEFVSSLKDDLSRRDFTVNAMAYSPAAGLVDYFGGESDLRSKLIRCVGAPDKRFREDALRIMRALRLASVYGFSIHGDTAIAIENGTPLLANIAVERINSELGRLLCGSGACDMLLRFGGVFAFIIPEAAPMMGLEQNNPYHCYDVWRHTAESVAQIEPDMVLRLTMLFHDIGKPLCYTEEDGVGHFFGHTQKSADLAELVLKRMRYDNRTVARVKELVLYHDAELTPRHKHIKRWLNKIGEESFRQLLKVNRADIKAQSAAFMKSRIDTLDEVENALDEILAQRQCFCLKDLEVSGRDLIAVGVPQGRPVGEMLNKLMDMVIGGDIANDRDTLLLYARENIN